MAKPIHERVRAELARQEKAQKVAAYKAGEHMRRSVAARAAAETRREKRDALIVAGLAIPSNDREDRIQCIALFGNYDDNLIP